MIKQKLLLVLTLLLLVSCNATGLKVAGVDVGSLVNQGINVIESQSFDEEKERALGQNLAGVLVSIAPIHESEAINKYVNKVGWHLAAHSQRPDIAWQFAVVAETER